MKKLYTYGDLVNNDINLTRVYPALKWLVTSEGDKAQIRCKQVRALDGRKELIMC